MRTVSKTEGNGDSARVERLLKSPTESRGTVRCYGCGGHWKWPNERNSLMYDERSARAWAAEHRVVCRGPMEVIVHG